MIPVKYRLNLRKNPDFFNHSQRFYSQLFLIFYQLKGEGSQTIDSRVAVVVPKKNIKKRTQRSRIKRRVFGVVLSIIEKHPNLELVIVVNKEIKDFSFQEIVLDLNKAFSSLNNDD
jgi:ribonuclease P protein component